MRRWACLVSVVTAAVPAWSRAQSGSASASVAVTGTVVPYAIASLASSQVSMVISADHASNMSDGFVVTDERHGVGSCQTNYNIMLSLRGSSLRRGSSGPELTWGTVTGPQAIGHWTAEIALAGAPIGATATVRAGTESALDVRLTASIDRHLWTAADSGAYAGTLVLSVIPDNKAH